MSPRKPASFCKAKAVTSSAPYIFVMFHFSILLAFHCRNNSVNTILSMTSGISSSKHKEVDDDGDSTIFIDIFQLLPPVLILKVVQAALQAATGGAASFDPDCIPVASPAPKPAPLSSIAESISLISSQIPATCLDAHPERVKVKIEKAMYAKGDSTKEQPAASPYVTLPFVLS
ncbi:hypothetical protein L208DRAFT_1382785 [Tricholoma matsutake]|nr:hypothetical protein L208DRAFT_1382785 [Tricholoma matsutake 945]